MNNITEPKLVKSGQLLLGLKTKKLLKLDSTEAGQNNLSEYINKRIVASLNNKHK